MELKPETVALAGNPNAGKTTLFNALCGRTEKIGNYGGVTVELKKGEFFTPHGRRLELIDLPGTFSLEGGSPDQRIASEVLAGKHEHRPAPDLVVCVVDASNLERHLQLTLEVLELGGRRAVVVAVAAGWCTTLLSLLLLPMSQLRDASSKGLHQVGLYHGRGRGP